MVEGFTQDTDIVVSGDGGNEDDNNHHGSDTGIVSGIGSVNPPLENTTDRSQYKIDRPEGDPLGQPQSITFNDGNKVNFSYDDNGNLVGVSDTASGVTMQHTDNGWLITNKDGTHSYANGDMSVDPETGALVLKTDSGYTVTTMPDGRTTLTDDKGQLVGVANPNYKVGSDSTYISMPAGGSGSYDNQGNLIRATDTYGTTFVKTGDGQWATMDDKGNLKAVDGEVKIDPYRGVYVDPASHNTRNITRGDQ